VDEEGEKSAKIQKKKKKKKGKKGERQKIIIYNGAGIFTNGA